jgi:coenzyme F420-reducing hydrogenase beta subunit
LDSVAARKGGAYGWRRVTLETNQQEISVILGPSWYLDQQQIAFTPGDILEVRGSRITYENVSCLMAAQVKKGKKTLKLRNKDGFPLWGGSRQRQ